jgi:hypothetical protein
MNELSQGPQWVKPGPQVLFAVIARRRFRLPLTVAKHNCAMCESCPHISCLVGRRAYHSITSSARGEEGERKWVSH